MGGLAFGQSHTDADDAADGQSRAADHGHAEETLLGHLLRDQFVQLLSLSVLGLDRQELLNTVARPLVFLQPMRRHDSSCGQGYGPELATGYLGQQ